MNTRGLRLLHVISSLDPRGGGPVEGIRQLARVDEAMGNTVEVVCLDAPDAPWMHDQPFVVHALGPSPVSYRYNARFVDWLREHAPRFDAVIVNGLWQYHGFAVWRALAGTPTPYFVFPHGMLDPWFKRAYPLKHLKKWLYWPWAEYRVLRDARAVIFTCEEEKLLARESFWLYRCNEVVAGFGTAAPPADRERLREIFFAAHPELEGKRLALFLSRIHEKKGCDLLIDAFARIARDDARLHLVMAGPEQPGLGATLRARAAELGIADRISWTGMIGGDLKWGAFYAAEVFCLPSHQENFGVAVAEALACGTPVVISNKVNIWREIEADAGGWIGDDSLAGTEGSLRRWLAETPATLDAKRANARRCFETRFRVERVAENIVEVLRAHGVGAALAGSAR